LVGACAALVQRLLSASPDLRILATSREPLGVPGEHLVRLPTLTAPVPPAPPLQQLAQYESVRLFIDRALLIEPAFAVTNENAPAMAEICHHLDGIPLALELAAAWVSVLSPEQLIARLEDRFRLLTGGSRTVLPRQQTLRATLDWSYDLLIEAERALLQRLAVFAGGWTLEAAEAVCAGEEIEAGDVLDLLARLAQKSLVLSEAAGNERRYRLLETIREYGSEKLQGAGEEAALRGRHRDWYLALAERAEPHLKGPQQQPWLERLGEEYDNLRAALRWSAEKGEADAGLRLGGALWWFWHVRGYLEEGRKRLAEVLAASQASEPTAARAKALNGAGGLAQDLGHYEEARSLYGGSLAIWRELGDKRGIAYSLGNLGSVASHTGEYSVARSFYEQTLALGHELEDMWSVAMALNHLGILALYQGQYAEARSLYEESLSIRRELGDKRSIAGSLSNLGIVARNEGDYGRARSRYTEALTINRELGDKQGIANTLNNLGNVAYSQGDHGRARSLHEESLEMRRALGDKSGVAMSLKNLGNVAHSCGNSEAARSFYMESLTIRQELGDKRGIAECLEGFAGLAVAQGKAMRSAHLFGAAYALRESVGGPVPSADRADYEGNVTAARGILGEEVFAAAWEAGQALSLDRAVALALDEAREA
jgi:predicted ATPase